MRSFHTCICHMLICQHLCFQTLMIIFSGWTIISAFFRKRAIYDISLVYLKSKMFLSNWAILFLKIKKMNKKNTDDIMIHDLKLSYFRQYVKLLLALDFYSILKDQDPDVKRKRISPIHSSQNCLILSHISGIWLILV